MHFHDTYHDFVNTVNDASYDVDQRISIKFNISVSLVHEITAVPISLRHRVQSHYTVFTDIKYTQSSFSKILTSNSKWKRRKERAFQNNKEYVGVCTIAGVHRLFVN